MKIKRLVLGTLIAGIFAAFFGGRAFATAGNVAEISGGKTWNICVDAGSSYAGSDFSADITKSGFNSQIVLGNGSCKAVKVEAGTYAVSLNGTMGTGAVNYEIADDTLTFNVVSSLRKYINVFGSIAYSVEGSGEESQFDLLFSMPGECQFNGNANVSGETCKDGDGNSLTNKKYIDTGVALFSEDNAAKDFEIYFTLTDYAATQTKQGTLFNAKYENSSMYYPGFTIRTVSTDGEAMEITGRFGKDNTNADKANNGITTADIKNKEVKIVRVGGMVSYSIDGGELIPFQDYKNFSRYFEQTAVFGASMQANGSPQRYYDGTIKNIRVYLKKLTKASIAFNANGGTGTMASIENIELGTNATLPANSFTKKNAIFRGWNTETDGSGTAYADEATVAITVAGKLTLYAQWEDIPVGSVEFDANGGSGSMETIEDIPVGTNTTLPANEFTMKNGTFIGWNTEADGSGTAYADEATVTITSTSGIYLYAQWEIRPVGSIKFDANGGSGQMAIINDIDLGTSVTLPANVYTLKNATFKGWNTRLDGTGTNYADEASVTITSTDRITLYAQWDGRAILTDGHNLGMTLKKLNSPWGVQGEWVNDNHIKTIKRANAIPDGAKTLVISDSIRSPIKIYAWFDDSDSDGDGEGDGVAYVFTTAEKIEGGEDFGYSFYHFVVLSDISELSNWDMSNVEDMGYVFYGDKMLTDISALSAWDVSNVKKTSSMFDGVSSLSDISALASWNTSSLERMTSMFGSTAITNVDALETKQYEGKDYVSWDVSNVKDMGNLFKYAQSLTDISALASWNTSSLTDARYMFYMATAITDVNALETKQYEGRDYVSWDVSNLANMSYMFHKAKSLADISALASWNTSGATNMSSMFDEAIAITDVNALETKQYEGRDYVSWDVSNVTDMSYMFRKTESLVNISALSSWNTSSVTNLLAMFNASAITNVNALETKQYEGRDYVSWDVSNVTNMSSVFANAASLSDITALASWNTSNVTSMGGLFSGTASLLDISVLANWNTSSVTNMASMFSSSVIVDVDALETKQYEGKDYVSWDTSNVASMSKMFYGAKSLSDITALASWDTSSVTSMESMFEQTESLVDISALSSWNTSSVTNLKGMFRYSVITNVNALETKQYEGKDYVSWDVSNVTDFSWMFNCAELLADISALASWNTSSATTMRAMLSINRSLTSVAALETKQHEGKDYVSWDVSNVTDMSEMFDGASALVDISALASWDISSVTTMNQMFYSASRVENPSALEPWNIDFSVDTMNMFWGVSAEPKPTWYHGASG